MEQIEKKWNPVEILTLKNRLIVIEINQNVNVDEIKKMGETDLEYKVIGTCKECMENTDLLNEVLEFFPKYEEVFDIPKNDPDGWEPFKFIDESGRNYTQMGRDKKYRRVCGSNYINYGIPSDVMEYFPLTSVIDSFITLLRKNGIYTTLNDYLILKQLNYEPIIEE
jgi:tetrahydromethanopterin S-methyltransferase subunit H